MPTLCRHAFRRSAGSLLRHLRPALGAWQQQQAPAMYAAYSTMPSELATLLEERIKGDTKVDVQQNGKVLQVSLSVPGAAAAAAAARGSGDHAAVLHLNSGCAV